MSIHTTISLFFFAYWQKSGLEEKKGFCELHWCYHLKDTTDANIHPKNRTDEFLLVSLIEAAEKTNFCKIILQVGIDWGFRFIADEVFHGRIFLFKSWCNYLLTCVVLHINLTARIALIYVPTLDTIRTVYIKDLIPLYFQPVQTFFSVNDSVKLLHQFAYIATDHTTSDSDPESDSDTNTTVVTHCDKGGYNRKRTYSEASQNLRSTVESERARLNRRIENWRARRFIREW